MKTVMVIPTYWGRRSDEGWQVGDQIYDHPTPIDKEGTLARTLESMKILDNKDFDLVILVAVTAPELREEACNKVKQIVQKCNPPVATYVFANHHLDKIKKIYDTNGQDNLKDLLLLEGYSNIRNMCLYTAFLLKADVVVLIDDDEIFEDSQFMDKAHEFIGGRLHGQTVDGVAGYYLNKYGNYYDDVTIEPWMTFWNRFGSKSKAFDKIIRGKPRLKLTPFAFGGCMIIHRNLFTVVPFDPNVPRGEDIDYVINSRMFGFNFFLDNQLAIKHLPPAKNHPVWQRLRQDIYRFFYERAKIRTQYEQPNMIMVKAEDFDPYPGEFLKDDLEDKIFKTNIILALDYLSNNKIGDCKATIKNIYLTKYDAEPKENVFEKFLMAHDRWEQLLSFADENSKELDAVMESCLIQEEKTASKTQPPKTYTYERLLLKISDLPFFRSLNSEEIQHISNIGELKKFKENETIVREGDEDNALYIIISGTAKIMKKHKATQEMVQLAELKKGEHFGETSLFTSKSTNYLADVIAEEPTEVLIISKKDLMEFFAKNHRSSVKLLLYLMKKLNDRLEDLTEMYTNIRMKNIDLSKIIEKI